MNVFLIFTVENTAPRILSVLSVFHQLVNVMGILNFDANDRSLVWEEKNKARLGRAAKKAENDSPLVSVASVLDHSCSFR